MWRAMQLTLNFSRFNINQIPTLKQFMQPTTSDSVFYDRKSFYIETYGCQMNVNDSEIVRSLLREHYNQQQAPEEADVVLLNTCAIRQAAQEKIHMRVRELKKNKIVGVLGCMAERLKQKMFEEGVRIICGPDAYRDLPTLLEAALNNNKNNINVQLSFEETYADINPVRKDTNSVTAFLSIMRGCNNMCSFCIVPFVRGRERSRDIMTILKEIKQLESEGVKQITFLGQNVNSYHYLANVDYKHENSQGFQETYKLRDNPGYRFEHLLQAAAEQFPNIRFRFTSPHPKDFPMGLLKVIAKNNNICNHIHLPAQSGNSEVLKRMRRNHTREAYLKLVQKIRSTIPGVTISTDLMCGFCGQTQEQFQETISLLRQVRYDMAFLFAYSLREKTHAHRNYEDDVPEVTKQLRLKKMIQVFEEELIGLNDPLVGTYQLVLVEKLSKRDPNIYAGRTDGFKKSYLPRRSLPVLQGREIMENRDVAMGDYVAVKVIKTGIRSLQCQPLAIMPTINTFYSNLEWLKLLKGEK